MAPARSARPYSAIVSTVDNLVTSDKSLYQAYSTSRYALGADMSCLRAVVRALIFTPDFKSKIDTGALQRFRVERFVLTGLTHGFEDHQIENDDYDEPCPRPQNTSK